MRSAPKPWKLALLLGCARPPTTPTPPREVTAPAPVEMQPPPSSAPEAPCPAIDDAALEPDTRHPDARTIALTRVFQREESRPSRVSSPPRLDLGRLVRPPPGPSPKGGGGFGLGWRGLEARWVAGALRPGLVASFTAWVAARERLGAHQRGRYLLDVRARHARSIEPPAAWGSRRCLERAAARAAEEERAAEAAAAQASGALTRALEALDTPRGGEALLLAYLLAQALPHPHASADAARPMALLTRVAGDASQDRELRARAAEQIASLLPPRSSEFQAALARVLELTRDPDLSVETLVKLAEISDDPARAEALRVEILGRLDRRQRPAKREDDHLRWRVAQTLAELAEARLERGAFALARADAARCARASADDFPRDPDPWGCATALAEATATLATPEDAEVPLAFLGPLALATMTSALARHDRDQARHVGALLLAELPEAAEVPKVLALLVALAPDPAEAAALSDRARRDLGPGSAWEATQRHRLAWEDEPAAVEDELAALREPPRLSLSSAPTTRAALEEDLRARGTRIVEACAGSTGLALGRIKVRVDTTGTTPEVAVGGGTPVEAGCLRREARAYFRSVGPARVAFEVGAAAAPRR